MSDSLIGQMGEFTAWDGTVYQCIVTGMDEPPLEDLCLYIDYVRRGSKIKGAMIALKSFRPKNPANA